LPRSMVVSSKEPNTDGKAATSIQAALTSWCDIIRQKHLRKR
jgi:hypothetical protein